MYFFKHIERVMGVKEITGNCILSIKDLKLYSD